MQTNFDKFMSVYEKHLRAVHDEHPEEYAWSITQIDDVVERMTAAIIRGSFNYNSLSFKRTCKEIGIKHTYKAIREFVAQVAV